MTISGTLRPLRPFAACRTVWPTSPACARTTSSTRLAAVEDLLVGPAGNSLTASHSRPRKRPHCPGAEAVPFGQLFPALLCLIRILSYTLMHGFESGAG